MSNVVETDFGKVRRDACRKMERLLGLIDQRDRELETNPTRLFSMAGAEIVRLRRALETAADALRPEIVPYGDGCAPNDLNVIRVDEREYRRLKRCAEIVEDALACQNSGGGE